MLLHPLVDGGGTGVGLLAEGAALQELLEAALLLDQLDEVVDHLGRDLEMAASEAKGCERAAHEDVVDLVLGDRRLEGREGRPRVHARVAAHRHHRLAGRDDVGRRRERPRHREQILGAVTMLFEVSEQGCSVGTWRCLGAAGMRARSRSPGIPRLTPPPADRRARQSEGPRRAPLDAGHRVGERSGEQRQAGEGRSAGPEPAARLERRTDQQRDQDP